MAWECSDCGQEEKGKSKITVCHHCGRPICNLHYERAGDDAFSGWTDRNATNVAIHCADCWLAFHPQAAPGDPGAASTMGLATA